MLLDVHADWTCYQEGLSSSQVRSTFLTGTFGAEVAVLTHGALVLRRPAIVPCCGSRPQDFSWFRPSTERLVGLMRRAGIRSGRSQVPLKSGHALPLYTNTQTYRNEVLYCLILPPLLSLWQKDGLDLLDVPAPLQLLGADVLYRWQWK